MTNLTWANKPWLSIPDAPAMPEAVESGMAEVNGISMYYATYGENTGIPILLIHGGLAHADIWASQVMDLSNDYRLIVADTRGRGRSTNDGSAYSISLLAKDYLALLDYLEVDQVHLVGWSDGANIGYEISKTAPNRLASHFAHAGNVTLGGVDETVNDDAVFGEYTTLMATQYAELSSTPDGFNDFLNAVVLMWFAEKEGGLELIEAIRVPTLVVHSAYDEAILLEHSQAISNAIPRAKLLILENVSHFSMFQGPQGYTDAIRAWVQAQ